MSDASLVPPAEQEQAEDKEGFEALDIVLLLAILILFVVILKINKATTGSYYDPGSGGH